MSAKRFLLIFTAMAAIPLLLAFAVLQFNWFTPGATNKGEFVDFDVKVPTAQEQQLWRIVYQPKQGACDAICEEQLYGLNQTFVALGKLQPKVKSLLFSKAVDVSEYKHVEPVAETFSQLSPNNIYLVDPFGQVILQYPANSQREQTIQTSKALLSDIKKLLKYSRTS